MDLEKAILNRRSVRKFQDREVPIDLIKQAIGLACWAPNGSNLQAWRFFIVKSREAIDRVASALQAKGEQMAGWPESADFEPVLKGIEKNASILRSAPALVIAGAVELQGPMDVLLQRRSAVDAVAREIIEDRAGASSNAQTVSSAVSQLLLALHSLGLAGCWMAGPMLARRDLERALGVPSGVRLFTVVPVGYPDEQPVPQARKPLEEIVTVL